MKTKIFALSLALIGLLAVTSCSKKFTVTVNSNNEAWGTATGSGTYLSGTTATLAAVPSENCYFVKWNDDVTDNPRTITVTNDITYTAYFAEMTDETFTVTVNSNNEAWGTATGSGTYAAGATATLAAVPSENCYFVKWNDDVTDNPRTITVTNDISYTAYFAEITDETFTVTVSSNNEAWGTVTGGGIYPSGATATLAAVPSENYIFVKWNDDVTDNPRSVIVTGDITYTAFFAEKTGGTFSFSGKVQKGPFVTGATITVNELNENLGQTGMSFTTTISSDDGSFSLNNIEMESDLALLSGNGFYFNEVIGQLSSSQITLQAFADLADDETVNINVLTHITKARVETLVGQGMSFSDAKRQAEGEFQDFLGVTQHFNQGFEQMSIASQGDFNAMLLAFSIILQRPTNNIMEIPTLPAELTLLMTNLSTDFAADGVINDQSLIDKLLSNISLQNQVYIRRRIQNYYSELGLNVEIPNFEYYIALFQAAHEELVTEFIYPDEATPAPEIGPSGAVPNILVKDVTHFDGEYAYVVAAITPLWKSLKVKATGNVRLDGSLNNGWVITEYSTDGFTIEAQRHNELVSMLVYLLDDNRDGSATIEYYEDSDTPTFTKQITWTGGWDYK